MVRQFKRNYLKEMLEESGVHINYFANCIGVSRAMVYLYIDNKNQPTMEVAKRMCSFFGVEIEDLFDIL